MRHCILLGMFLTFIGFASALSPDATREQVITELGKPTSVAKLGAREILIYPKGVRLELEEGRVVAANGIALTDSTAVPDGPTEAKQSAVKPANEPGRKPEPVAKPKPKALTDEELAEREFSDERSKSQAAMEKAVEGLESSHDQGQRPAPAKAFVLRNFLVELVLKLFLTVASLKLACKYWGAEVFWSGILTVSAVDVVIRGGMGLIGSLVLGFPTLFYADELVAAIVMVLLLKKLSINHSIAQAIELTMTSKTFSIVVGSFLVTVLLRLMH